MDFADSALGTLGVEYEATVIDRTSSELRHLAGDIASSVQPLLERGRMAPDFFDSTLEFCTGICTSIAEARADLMSMWEATRPMLDDQGLALLGMGIHPRASHSEVRVVDSTRYRTLLNRLAFPAQIAFSTGIHVHVGMRSGDEAISVANRIRPVLPVLLALGAASPFLAGEHTGLASSRTHLYGTLPRSGVMPTFHSWADYTLYSEALVRAGSTIQSQEFWWDCRPSPQFGTVEIRVMDSIPDLDDVMALVALAWCLAVGSDVVTQLEIPPLLVEDNRWRAIRFGVHTDLIVDASGATEPLALVTERLVDLLADTAQRLGCLRELQRCVDLGWGRAAHQHLTPPHTTTDGLLTQVDDMVASALTTMRVDW